MKKTQEGSWGRRMRLSRMYHEHTQTELAEMVGTNTSEISRFETGSRQPCPEMLDKIERCLRMGVHGLRKASAWP